MKHLRNALLTLVVLLTGFGLTACGNAEPAKKAAPKASYTVTLKVDKKQVAKKRVIVVKKQSLMTAMKKHFKVEETKGFINSINGHKQDAAKNIYWMYDVNGKQAPKGAKETFPKKGDKVVFKLAEVKY